MASIRNFTSQESNCLLKTGSPVEDRVFMLSQKINSFKLPKPE